MIRKRFDELWFYFKKIRYWFGFPDVQDIRMRNIRLIVDGKICKYDINYFVDRRRKMWQFWK